MAKTGDSLKIMKQELDSTTKLVQVQQERIKSKDSTISDLKSANIVANQEIETFKLDKINITQQRDLFKEDMNYFRKIAKGSNAGAWVGSGFGLLVVIASYLIFHK